MLLYLTVGNGQRLHYSCFALKVTRIKSPSKFREFLSIKEEVTQSMQSIPVSEVSPDSGIEEENQNQQNQGQNSSYSPFENGFDIKLTEEYLT